MITITVKTDPKYKMACVDDGLGNGMEGNYWDFHNGCHGLYHLKDFNGIWGLVDVLQKMHKGNREQVQVIKQTYNCLERNSQ